MYRREVPQAFLEGVVHWRSIKQSLIDVVILQTTHNQSQVYKNVSGLCESAHNTVRGGLRCDGAVIV